MGRRMLLVMRELPDERGRSAQILQEVDRRWAPQWTSEDLDLQRGRNGETKWYNRANFMRNRFKDRGIFLPKEASGRGIWALSPQGSLMAAAMVESDEEAHSQPVATFALDSIDPPGSREVATRPGQVLFAESVRARYGPSCVVCDLTVPHMLQAAHIKPKAVGGTDDPLNGLLLCANHHLAFDAQLWTIRPFDLAVLYTAEGPNAGDMGITRASLNHLNDLPHPDAVTYRYELWSSLN